MGELIALGGVVLCTLLVFHFRQPAMRPEQRRRIWRNLAVLGVGIVATIGLLMAMASPSSDTWPRPIRPLAVLAMVALILFTGLRLVRVREDALHDRTDTSHEWVIYLGAATLALILWLYALAKAP
jgi:drug/metabolite transporter (DMT)-like permease